MEAAGLSQHGLSPTNCRSTSKTNIYPVVAGGVALVAACIFENKNIKTIAKERAGESVQAGVVLGQGGKVGEV